MNDEKNFDITFFGLEDRDPANSNELDPYRGSQITTSKMEKTMLHILKDKEKEPKYETKQHEPFTNRVQRQAKLQQNFL